MSSGEYSKNCSLSIIWSLLAHLQALHSWAFTMMHWRPQKRWFFGTILIPWVVTSSVHCDDIYFVANHLHLSNSCPLVSSHHIPGTLLLVLSFRLADAKTCSTLPACACLRTMEFTPCSPSTWSWWSIENTLKTNLFLSPSVSILDQSCTSTGVTVYQ